jgi:hypothetical protein
MDKATIIRKLTSRKLWMSIASFVTLLLVAKGMSAEGAAQVAAIIMAGATVIGYVLAEGLADAGYNSTVTYTEAETVEETE